MFRDAQHGRLPLHVDQVYRLGTSCPLRRFTPETYHFSSGVERLVRRLMVIEETLHISRKDLGAFYERLIGVLEIGGGETSPTHHTLAQLRTNTHRYPLPMSRLAIGSTRA